MSDLARDLSAVLNRYSVENGSNTPDFLLAEYLLACLKAYEQAIQHRAQWHNKQLDKVFQTGATRHP